MATLVTPPNALNPIEKGVKWVFTQDPGTADLEQRMGYRLSFNGTDVFNKDKSVLPLSSSDPIILDMKEDLLGLVRTRIPSPTLVGTENDPGAIGEASLAYGQIDIDKTTDPPTVTKNIASSSGPFKVINSAINVFDSADMTAITARVLSWLPQEIEIFWNTRLYIWFLGGTGVQYNWKYKDGTTGSTGGSSAGFDVGIIPLSPANIGISNPQDLVRITATLVAISKTYTIWMECAIPKLNTAAIMFLEPLGGRSTVAFHEVSGMGFASSFNLIKKHLDPALSFGTFQQVAGYSLAGKQGGAARSFSKFMKVTDETLHYVDGFFGSSEYHLQHVNTAGAYVWNKFILTGGAFQIDSYSGYGILTASGYLANQVISQRGHV